MPRNPHPPPWRETLWTKFGLLFGEKMAINILAYARFLEGCLRTLEKNLVIKQKNHSRWAKNILCNLFVSIPNIHVKANTGILPGNQGSRRQVPTFNIVHTVRHSRHKKYLKKKQKNVTFFLYGIFCLYKLGRRRKP